MIKLQTEIDEDGPQMCMRYKWHRRPFATAHDTAVAHALMKAIREQDDGFNDHTIGALLSRAAEILRDEFGIEE